MQLLHFYMNRLGQQHCRSLQYPPTYVCRLAKVFNNIAELKETVAVRLD